MQRVCEARDHSNLSDSIGSRFGGARCGPGPEREADDRREHDRADDRRRRQLGLDRRDASIMRGREHAEPGADRAADHRHQRRLDEELHEDRPPSRTERAPHADLARPFGDRHQHDVHHADSADEQRDEADRDRDAEQRRGLLVEDLDELRLAIDREGVAGLGGSAARAGEPR